MSRANLSKRTSAQKGSKSSLFVNSGVRSRLTKQQREEDEYYVTNSLLIASLLPLIPAAERESVHKWLKKLSETKATPHDRSIRNDYIWFLLIQLEGGAVTLPFVNEPPVGPLKPVTEAVEKKLYEEILEAANNRSADLDDIELPARDETTIGAPIEYQQLRPSEFLQNQPKPKFGFIAYGACFSDQR